MEKDVPQVEEEGLGGAADEETGGQSAKPDGKKSKFTGYVKIISSLPTRQVYFMDEQRMKLLKHGVDVPRSRVISVALERLMQDVSEGKFELKP